MLLSTHPLQTPHSLESDVRMRCLMDVLNLIPGHALPSLILSRIDDTATDHFMILQTISIEFKVTLMFSIQTQVTLT